MSEYSFLRELAPFRGLEKPDLQRLLDGARRASFAPGTTILRRGDPGDSMFVILAGEVQIPVMSAQGATRFIACLQAGDLFGEMALLTGEARSADVIVSEQGPCECVVLDRTTVDDLLRRHPAVAEVLTEILGQRIEESEALRRVGKYRILSVLGRGGMATVYEGFHPILRQAVAIKMLSHRLVYREEFARRFREEAQLLASLRHPGIVRVFDAEEGFGTHFIVMERLEGTDLDRVLWDRDRFDFEETRDALMQIAGALEYAHEAGVVHRDIKPANVFMGPSGRLRLVDFGISTGPASGIQEDDKILCSPDYVAPEIVRAEAVDGRADIYALGIMAFRMLAGRLPFPGEDVEQQIDMHLEAPLPDLDEAIPGLPEDLRRFIERATQKRPEDRYADCKEVQEVLREGLGSEPSGAMRSLAITLYFGEEDCGHVAHLRDRIREVLAEYPQVSARFKEE